MHSRPSFPLLCFTCTSEFRRTLSPGWAHCVMLADLPPEILALVVHAALDGSDRPSDVLCVCKLFCALGTERLYTHLWFTSAEQLRLFVHTAHPDVAPRTLAVHIEGAQRGALRDLCDALVKCRERVGEGPVRLGMLRLRMHSYQYAMDAVDALERGLQAVSPDVFEWTGPDPEHHFSTAIVPPVATCLFKHFPSWCNLREITVTNISFATISDPVGRCPPLLDDVPSLRSLYIGQATFLHPQAVAGTLRQGRLGQLETIRLVDAYSASIWGPRLRKSDIEKAVSMSCRTEEEAAVIARVQRVVTCEKKTERIIGGDRVEGTHILD